MFEISINLSDPSKNTYYYPVIICIALLLIILELIMIIIKEATGDLNTSLNNKTLQSNISYPDSLIQNKNSLRFRYLLAFVLTRAAMWSKAPYLYTLFMTLQKFSMAEIGILYLVDAVAAFIFGPITGQYADIYGRKLFCHVYNISIIINLLLRMEGHRWTAYLAQVITGLGAGLINTTFEAWVVYESQKVFTDNCQVERERFLKKIFRASNKLDAVMGIIISAICAIIYSYFGIFAPLWISIILSALAFIVIAILWDENKPQEGSKKNPWTLFGEACGELKNREVLSIGLIEGIVMAVLNIFLFSWTPILKQSTPGGMNVGFIFTCMLLTMIVGTTTYEMTILHLRCDFYASIGVSLFVEGTLFILVYFIDSFFLRLIFLSLINGFQGFYNPLNSIIKSKILVEKYRASLMNIFRIPLNLYVIIVLCTLKYMNPFHVALIAGIMSYISFVIGLSLIIWKFRKGAKNKPIGSLIMTEDDGNENENENENEYTKFKSDS